MVVSSPCALLAAPGLSSHSRFFWKAHCLMIVCKMAAPTGRFSRVLPTKLIGNFNSVKENLRVPFPERLRGTIVEKWATYWQNILIDYREVAKDTMKDVRTRPIRSAFIACGMGAASYCISTNPNETSFRDMVVSMANEMTLVPKSILNSKAASHIQSIESFYNQGIIRRLNIGVASFIWIDNYDPGVGIYASQCSYLKPSYLRFYERIIDVGFLGHWWIIEKAMVDFDVNPSEWENR